MTLPRPLANLLTAQLRTSLRSPRLLTPSASPAVLSFRSAPGFQSSRGVQTVQTLEERVAALQERQKKMSDKAGRMKNVPGAMAPTPVFANHIRPRSSRKTPTGLSYRDLWTYFKMDRGNDVYTLWMTKFKFKQALGPEWEKKFLARSEEAYKGLNYALATGNFTILSPLGAPGLIDVIKSQRSVIGPKVRMSWQLHGELKQEIVCARQQELRKTDEFVGQIAVKFTSSQSLEMKNERGDFVGKGRHSSPNQVSEYYVFQREMWRPDDNWTLVKRVQETDPLDPLASMGM